MRLLRRSASRESGEHVVIQSTSQLQRDDDEEPNKKFSSIVKKPFRCFASNIQTEKEYEEMPHVLAPEQYVNDYGFEATLQEGKKKKYQSRSQPGSIRRSKSREKKKSSSVTSHHANVEEQLTSFDMTRNQSFEEPPPSYMAPYPLTSPPHGGGGSFEESPPGDLFGAIVPCRSRSFADAIPPGKKNDPLDNESIRDVSKALREMERKLDAAGTEGKKVSRTKVMKALLTVVDQLDDQYEHKHDFPSPSNDASFANTTNSSMSAADELYRTWAGGPSEEAIALDRHRRNMEQMRELTITPNSKASVTSSPKKTSYPPPPLASDSPWKGDKPSFSKLTQELKGTETAETEAEPDYISSSSDEEEQETLFSQDSFSTTGKAENSTFYSEDTPSFKKKGKSRKGSFAHAVSPSTAIVRSTSPSNSAGIFNLDIQDPAVQDALSDLLWIQSPTKSIEASTANVVSPAESPSKDVALDKQKESESMLSYHASEQEYYDDDKPNVCEESATSTTQSSYTANTSTSQAHKQTQKQTRRRENSWWQRRNRAALKPPSKDTPVVQETREWETRVTVTHYDGDDLDPWRPQPQWQQQH